MTFFAGWFWFHRTFTPLLHGVFHQFRAFTTKEDFPAGYFLNFIFCLMLDVMLCYAIDPNKVDQDFQFLFLNIGELPHACILDEKVKERHDTGQKTPFSIVSLLLLVDMLRYR